MTSPPDNAKIYHITHVENLPDIVSEGGLLSDREMLSRGGPRQAVGMSTIKRRRVEELEVDCHPGTKVGDYVPFYFCPRSVMLYVIHRANHPELDYRGGQESIVHLEADLHAVIRWAKREDRQWAFSLSNAGACYTEFRSKEDDLGDLDWAAIAATDFRPSGVKEHKQAEFLVHESFPFELVSRIGVRSSRYYVKADAGMRGASHRPLVEVRDDWYY